jgi:hypothetical protein
MTEYFGLDGEPLTLYDADGNVVTMPSKITHTEDIADLMDALAAAQGEFTPVLKATENLYFKSRYADLADVLKMALPILSKHKIALLQPPSWVNHLADVVVTTRIAKGAQWLESEMRLFIPKLDPQGQGSAITYGRRYAACAMLGIVADVDDDGNSATEAVQSEPAPPDIFVKAGWANQGDYDEVRKLTRLELKRMIDAGDIPEEDARLWWDEWKSVTPRPKASHVEMWERLRAPLAPVIGQQSQEPAPEASEAPEATQAPLSEPPQVQRYPMSASELVAAGVTDPELVDALEAVEKMSPSQITKGLKDRALPHEGSSTERHSRLGFAMAYDAHMEPKLSALPAPAKAEDRE